MDIADILEHHYHITRFDDWMILVMLLFCFSMVGVLFLSIAIATRVDSNKGGLSGLAIFLGTMLAGAGVLCLTMMGVMAVWPHGAPTEKDQETITKITATAEAYYGVDLQEADVQKAWFKMSDSEVNVVAGTHDGKKKSLGIQVDEKTKTITIYEGNVELDPVK